MGKIGKDTRMKRQLAPSFWEIGRKNKRFALATSPGTHATAKAYPLGIFLRDILKVVNTMREAKYIVTSGDVRVDGVLRKNINFPVGLMDVIEISTIDKIYRAVPREGLIVKPIEIPEEEKNLKLCKVTRKLTSKNTKLQYGLHDGRTLIDEQKMNVHDSCLITVPEQKLTKTVKLEKGSIALVISGDNAGIQGKVEEIREGTFVLPKRVLVTLEEREVELPIGMVIAVGIDKPLIKIQG
ncbi:MAG: 30S ribosomal protein S4e [Nitrososphaerales archaeon]